MDLALSPSSSRVIGSALPLLLAAFLLSAPNAQASAVATGHGTRMFYRPSRPTGREKGIAYRGRLKP